MTTTAFDDQFVSATETILARNVRDECQQVHDLQVRLVAAVQRAEAAEEELARLREQKPVAWMDAEGDTYKEEPPENWCPPHVPLYASFAHVMRKGATHCDDCGLTWLDDGLNPLRCPYCKDTVSAPAVSEPNPVQWLEDEGDMILVPRGLLGAACSAIENHRKAEKVLDAMRYYTMNAPQAPTVPTNTIPEGDDFNGTTPHMIRCIESLVSMNDRGALSPHGLCGHSRTLLLASANRLRQQQAHVVPDGSAYLLERQENGLSWYVGATTCFGGAWHWTADVNSAIRFSREEDAAACWNIIARHHVGIGGSGTTETTPKQHIFEDARALLQSAEVTK